MGSTFYHKRYQPPIGRNRKRRPKSFKTEEQARKYAEELGVEDYKIEMLQERKFRVRV